MGNFQHRNQQHKTTLSTHVWRLKGQGQALQGQLDHPGQGQGVQHLDGGLQALPGGEVLHHVPQRNCVTEQEDGDILKLQAQKGEAGSQQLTSLSPFRY